MRSFNASRLEALEARLERLEAHVFGQPEQRENIWTANRVAKRLGIAVSTLKCWMRCGVVRGQKLANGQWMVNEEDAKRFMAIRNMPIQPAPEVDPTVEVVEDLKSSTVAD